MGWVPNGKPPRLLFASHSHNVPPPPRHSEVGRGNPIRKKLGRTYRPGGIRVCPACEGKGVCACSYGQVSNIRLRPSPRVDLRATGVPGTNLAGAAFAAPTSFATQSPASLLDGVNAAICQRLGIRHLGHKSALLEISQRKAFPAGAVDATYSRIASNWQLCRQAGIGSPSAANWRWRVPQLAISAHNTSPEVRLERALIVACERLGRSDWSNQVPVASGVAGANAERRRAIDLVHQRGPGHFELVELKVASDTPLYAAFEIIGYTCIWLLSKLDLSAPDNHLLTAQAIDAVVLAPTAFYAPYRLDALRLQLHDDLQLLGHEHGVALSFRFEAFPDRSANPPWTDEQLAHLLDSRSAI